MKFLFVIIVSICIFLIKADNVCGSTEPKSMSECIARESGNPHLGCCGINIGGENSCMPFGNTEASRAVLNKISRVMKENKVDFDYQCPNKDDEIKGKCEEFFGVFVNNPNDCLKLATLSNNTSCCGLRGKFVYNDYNVIVVIPQTVCLPLSTNKAEREETIQEMIKRAEGRMKFDDYTCGNENCFKQLLLIVYIFAMLILF